MTNFDEIWHGDAFRTSWSSWPLKIKNFTNPRWRRPPSWEIVKWPYLSRGLSDFDKTWYDGAVEPFWASRPLKISNFKNSRWRRPPSWKIEKSSYLGRSSTDFDAIWHNDAFEPLDRPSRSSNIGNFANPIGGRHPNNLKITISRQRFEQPSDF